MEKGKKMVVLLVGGSVLTPSLVIGLTKMGYAAEWVSTGEEALERLGRYKSDYDIMIIVPAFGSEAQHSLSCAVKKMPEYRELLIICLSDDVEQMKKLAHPLVPNAIEELQKICFAKPAMPAISP